MKRTNGSKVSGYTSPTRMCLRIHHQCVPVWSMDAVSTHVYEFTIMNTVQGCKENKRCQLKACVTKPD